MAKKVIPQTSIFNYKSKEFYINLSPSDIPPKGSDERKDFITWEKEKCKKGVTINGIFIPPSLYWHLNHIKIDIDELDSYGNPIAVSNIPELRDNDWIFHNGYWQAYNRPDKKILQVLGSRQLGKSVNESSILLHQAQIFKNSRCLLLGGNKGDIGVITKYINTMHFNMTPFLKVPLLDKDFNKPEVKFGYKGTDNTDNVYSSLFIRNTDEGKVTEVGAGVTINVAVIDECGKFEFSEAFAAIKPALVSRFGWRASPIITGTGGSFEKGKDAKKYFFKPKANDVLPFEQEDGKETGLFISGLYRQDGKVETTFKDLVTSQEPIIKNLTSGVYKKNTTELDNMRVWIKDDNKAKAIIQAESDNYLQNNDQLEYLKHKMYYPQEYNDIFLSKSTNPYYSDGLKAHLQNLLSNPVGQAYDLYKTPSGEIKISFSQKPVISTFPTPPEYLFRDSAIVIYDQVRYDKEQTYKIHVAGCLPPGEKVMTDKGLKNIESVTFNDYLINEKGENDNIKNIQMYLVENEDLYEYKLANTYRTTKFTKEHPLLISEDKIKYISFKKAKRLGVKSAYRHFDFSFKKAENTKEKDWVKIPNLYKKEMIPDFNFLWNDFECKNCSKIANPLEQEEFWWLVGLFLGDGWISKHGIDFVFNKKENYYIEKFKNISKKLFNRSPSLLKEHSGDISFSITCKQVHDFFVKHFGKYSHGKIIPEWVKYLPKKYKIELVKGYLNSDGCVSVNNKNKAVINFVSINLLLVESFQDILFSLGLISSIKLLRKAGIRDFQGRVCNTKECYSLDLCFTETIELLKLIYEKNDPKTSKLDFIEKNINKSYSGCRFDSNKDYVYFQITEIKKTKYTGVVYNFECDSHTFCSHHITTHNCDPYNTDQTKTSDSLGSIYVLRRQNTNVGEDNFQDTMVASYTGRPAKLEDFHKNVMYLLEYYNATVLNEASNSTFFQYFDNKQKGHYVEDAVQLQREINPNSQAMNMKGLAATPKNKQFRQDLIVKYMYDDESFDGKPGYTRILDPILCMELLEFNPDNKKGNYDRIDGFGHALVHLFKEKKYRPIVDIEYEKQEVKEEIRIRKNAFGIQLNKRGNAFGIRK